MGVKIRQKGGKWYVFINHHGQRKAKCVGDSKRAAEEVRRKLEAKLTLGEFAIEDEKITLPTLGQYAERWLETYARHNCKESTYVRYAGVVRNHLLPSFGTMRLTEITREAIKRMMYDKRTHGGLTSSSIRQILAPLREMLNHAVEDGILASKSCSPSRPIPPATS